MCSTNCGAKCDEDACWIGKEVTAGPEAEEGVKIEACDVPEGACTAEVKAACKTVGQNYKWYVNQHLVLFLYAHYLLFINPNLCAPIAVLRHQLVSRMHWTWEARTTSFAQRTVGLNATIMLVGLAQK